MRTAGEQYEHITRTVDVDLPEGALLSRLEEGRPLRVKLGVDPTAPDVTLGWAVVFDLLRRFQEMGHTAVLIVGDFTAQVGDPSERTETRRRLADDEVGGYVDTTLPIIRELLLSEPLEVRHNSEWLGAMDMQAVLDLTSKVTVARIMDRDDFTKRWEGRQPISMIEFLYPLLQGMDSVAVDSDVEIGGSDQLWNLLVGRDLQERFGQKPQTVMTVPLLVGTDGTRKMSQSLGNYVSVKEEPAEMFGKVMSIPDKAMGEWFALALGLPRTEAADITKAVEAGSLHPGDAKRDLGRRIVERYWGKASSEEAEAAFDRLFVDREIPDDVPEIDLPAGNPVWLPALLNAAGMVTSNSEARRLIAQGAVRLDGRRLTDEHLARSDAAGAVVQVGKRRFVRLTEGREPSAPD